MHSCELWQALAVMHSLVSWPLATLPDAEILQVAMGNLDGLLAYHDAEVGVKLLRRRGCRCRTARYKAPRLDKGDGADGWTTLETSLEGGCES